jgi:hypothetical protein
MINLAASVVWLHGDRVNTSHKINQIRWAVQREYQHRPQPELSARALVSIHATYEGSVQGSAAMKYLTRVSRSAVPVRNPP